MYKHVVFWKMKDEADGKSREELSAEVKRKLDTLPWAIPEIREYETATNIGKYAASFYDVCLISAFDNKDAFWEYTKYPEHDEVVDYIKSVQESEQIVDYEF